MVVPITTHQARLTGQTWVNNIEVSADDPDSVAEDVTAVERLLRLTHHLTQAASDDFTVRNIADVQQVRMATVQTRRFCSPPSPSFPFWSEGSGS